MEKEKAMPSFDIVSEIDMNQANNAVENAKRELETRYDFRGVDAKIEFKKDHIELTAEADQQVMQQYPTAVVGNECITCRQLFSANC